MEERTPAYYDVIPEFNSAGRLCNYHTGGEGDTVRVMAAEWERFNQLAGRQHEIIDGVVTYNADLAPCMPDVPPEIISKEKLSAENKLLKAQVSALQSELELTSDVLSEVIEIVMA